MLEDFVVPDDLIGSTYAPGELLTALYLENLYLRQYFQPQYRTLKPALPTMQQIATDSRYLAAKRFDEAHPQQKTGLRHLVIANTYPNYGEEYGNGFVHRRVKFYQQCGIDVDVIAMPRRTSPYSYEYDGVRVHVGNGDDLHALLTLRHYDSVSLHFLNPNQFAYLQAYRAFRQVPVTVFIHGYEAARWVRRVQQRSDSTTLNALIERTVTLQSFWSDVMAADPPIDNFVVVSNFFRKSVEEDMDIVLPARRTHVIHNVIDENVFRYAEKNPEDRFKILWVRSATATWYGADIAAEVLSKLLAGPFGDRITATIIGDGQYFHLFEDAFNDDPRVDVQRRFANQEEIAQLHREHGLFLVPTRLDSQGVSRDESMSSGLVPITNRVAAIPEFVDDTCAILADGEDIEGMVAGVERVLAQPELFLAMSAVAAQRVRERCGVSNTVAREISLIAPTLPMEGQ
ncbi:glycosyl transferase [Corynebacterium sp. 13CS0277]|uniref:glycosyltransferase family 4 protein n=1 Tax=Corynebacterium sp. 13CS0277 TaxID=2071994 RepID=UPI000D0319E9|nr:glycosyltransferase family 4 protein [Corynebacterium sp. 13CS0277]PRQ10310.1 glycosyl transferase [Corynebacterium sp. 13CS0277]